MAGDKHKASVEKAPEGVPSKSAPLFKPTRVADVFGSLPHRGPPKTLEEMQAGITAEAERRHARRRS